MTTPAPPPRPAPAAPPLVGRDHELAALREALAAAFAGHGSLVLIGGEAGLGKTTLAEALLDEATAQGALVLVGRCYDLSVTPPYGPWATLLASVSATADQPPPHALLGAPGASVTSQATLFAEVRDVLAALATARPLVLLLDDLHWADPASLDLLRYLARELANLPLLLLATYRADELTRRHPLYALLPTLVRETRAERLDLRPLDDADLRALVLARYALPPAETARLVGYLGSHTEGNPFYIGELLRSLEGERVLRQADRAWRLGNPSEAHVPPLLRQVIDARVDRLGEAARGLLVVAAVIGQEVPLDLWQAVSGTDEDTLLAVVETATEARLLTVTNDGRGVRFAHALIREALYEGTPPLRRRTWHRRTAEALLAMPDPDPDVVAHHFRQAGDARAYVWLVRAGERAQATYAYLTAAERFDAAQNLLGTADDTASERGWLLFLLARLRRYTDPQGSIAYLDEAARLAARATDRALEACIPLERGLFRCIAGEIRRGLDEMADGVAAYDTLASDEQARTWALRTDDRNPTEDDGRGTLAFWLAYAGRYAEARQLGERVLALADRRGGAVHTVDAYNALAFALAGLGLPEAAERAFELTRDACFAVGHYMLAASTSTNQLQYVLLPYQTDRLAERQRLAVQAESARARAGDGLTESAQPPRLNSLPLLEIDGRWSEVRAIGEAWRAARGTRVWDSFASLLARLAQRQGEPDRAWAHIHEWLPAGPAADPGDMAFFEATALQRLAVALALDAGDLAAAGAWLATHDRWLAWADAVLYQAEGHLGWATYHRAAGDHAAARARAEAALALATTPRQPLALLATRRFLGELDTEAGQRAEAARHLAEALALADACAAPYERALTLLALAELHLAGGDRAAAETRLAEARAILEPLEARPALARADALAAGAHARAGRAASPPQSTPAALPFRLTAREAEVLRLVVQGLTNAQAADRLFVTSRTVNAHLTAIYTKLGVEGRPAAIRIALDHGLR